MELDKLLKLPALVNALMNIEITRFMEAQRPHGQLSTGRYSGPKPNPPPPLYSVSGSLGRPLF